MTARKKSKSTKPEVVRLVLDADRHVRFDREAESSLALEFMGKAPLERICLEHVSAEVNKQAAFAGKRVVVFADVSYVPKKRRGR